MITCRNSNIIPSITSRQAKTTSSGDVQQCQCHSCIAPAQFTQYALPPSAFGAYPAQVAFQSPHLIANGRLQSAASNVYKLHAQTPQRVVDCGGGVATGVVEAATSMQNAFQEHLRNLSLYGADYYQQTATAAQLCALSGIAATTPDVATSAFLAELSATGGDNLWTKTMRPFSAAASVPCASSASSTGFAIHAHQNSAFDATNLTGDALFLKSHHLPAVGYQQPNPAHQFISSSSPHWQQQQSLIFSPGDGVLAVPGTATFPTVSLGAGGSMCPGPFRQPQQHQQPLSFLTAINGVPLPQQGATSINTCLQSVGVNSVASLSHHTVQFTSDQAVLSPPNFGAAAKTIDANSKLAQLQHHSNHHHTTGACNHSVASAAQTSVHPQHSTMAQFLGNSKCASNVASNCGLFSPGVPEANCDVSLADGARIHDHVFHGSATGGVHHQQSGSVASPVSNSSGAATTCSNASCQHDDYEDSNDDSSSEESSSTSASNQKDGKFCECWHCELFGHSTVCSARRF